MKNQNTRVKIKKEEWIMIAVITLLPVLCCALYALIDGHSPFSVSLRYSTWNDELFYYKLVEGVVSKGYPRGFFGFNESHAKVLSFAAWSPTLILPWAIPGKIFGWNLFSPYIFNIVFYCGALFFFGITVKPNLKKTLLFAVPFMLFPLNYRYMFSVMPEIIVWALLIVFYTLAVKAVLGGSTAKGNQANSGNRGAVAIIFMFVVSALLTTMRPYFILLMFLPALMLFISAKGKKKIFAALISMGAMFATFVVYYLIKKFLGAPYFTPLFDVTWLFKFKTDGFSAGLSNLVSIFVRKNIEIFHRIVLAFTVGSQSDGAIYFVYIVLILAIMALVVIKLIRRDKKGILPLIHCGASMLIVLLAIEIMYKPYEGSKHLLAFIPSALILIVSLGLFPKENTSKIEKGRTGQLLRASIPSIILVGFISLSFIAVMITKRADQTDYYVPYSDGSKEAESQYWNELLSEKMSLSGSTSPSYEDTVIWVYGDVAYDPEDTSFNSDYWQLLYELPKGFGISCCMYDYVAGNEVKSGYVTAPAGGNIDHEFSASADWEEIGRSTNMVMYGRK